MREVRGREVRGTEVRGREDWRAKAAAVARRRRSVWIGCGLMGALVVAAMTIATSTPSPDVRLAAAVAAGVAFAAMMIWSTVFYMRGVDEQERDANLWSGYVGVCVYLVLFAATVGAGKLGFAVPHADLATALIVVATMLGVFAWKKFR